MNELTNLINLYTYPPEKRYSIDSFFKPNFLNFYERIQLGVNYLQAYGAASFDYFQRSYRLTKEEYKLIFKQAVDYKKERVEWAPLPEGEFQEEVDLIREQIPGPINFSLLSILQDNYRTLPIVHFDDKSYYFFSADETYVAKYKACQESEHRPPIISLSHEGKTVVLMEFKGVHTPDFRKKRHLALLVDAVYCQSINKRVPNFNSWHWSLNDHENFFYYIDHRFSTPICKSEIQAFIEGISDLRSSISFQGYPEESELLAYVDSIATDSRKELEIEVEKKRKIDQQAELERAHKREIEAEAEKKRLLEIEAKAQKTREIHFYGEMMGDIHKGWDVFGKIKKNCRLPLSYDQRINIATAALIKLGKVSLFYVARDLQLSTQDQHKIVAFAGEDFVDDQTIWSPCIPVNFQALHKMAEKVLLENNLKGTFSIYVNKVGNFKDVLTVKLDDKIYVVREKSEQYVKSYARQQLKEHRPDFITFPLEGDRCLFLAEFMGAQTIDYSNTAHLDLLAELVQSFSKGEGQRIDFNTGNLVINNNRLYYIDQDLSYGKTTKFLQENMTGALQEIDDNLHTEAERRASREYLSDKLRSNPAK